MAIENLELSNQREQNANLPALVSADATLQANKILTACMQKIRHPLIENEMMLYGFIGEIASDNIYDEYEVNGLNIRFKRRDSENFVSYKIYPKILIDSKQSCFYNLFPQLKEIDYYSGHDGGRKDWGEEPENKENFYFFKNNCNTVADVFSDELYLVCKYMENGKFKYGVFAPQEVIIEQ